MSEYIAKCNEVAGISGKTLVVPDYIDTSKEIVRCRDCKRYIPQGTYRFSGGVVNKDTCDVIRGFVVQIEPDGFCAWGARADE